MRVENPKMGIKPYAIIDDGFGWLCNYGTLMAMNVTHYRHTKQLNNRAL